MAERDPALRQIVRGQFHGDPVTRQYTDTIPAQAASQVGQNYSFMFELHAEQTARKLLEHGAGNFNAVFFAQSNSFLMRIYCHARKEPALNRPDLVTEYVYPLRLYDRYIGRLQTLGSFGHLKLYCCAFIQTQVTLRLDGGEMNENVLSIFTLNESKALGCVKPLDCAFFSHATSLC
jgi:hypothetical protein